MLLLLSKQLSESDEIVRYVIQMSRHFMCFSSTKFLLLLLVTEWKSVSRSSSALHV